MNNIADKIMTCAQAMEFEKSILPDPISALSAIHSAGGAVADGILREFGGRLGSRPAITVLVGKGNNGADALCASRLILKKLPQAELRIFFASPLENMKPHAAFFAKLILCENGRVRIIKKDQITKPCDMLIEGIFGMSFKPPMRPDFKEILDLANSAEASLKVSIDLPAGLSDEFCDTVFKADVSYMTGIAKAPMFEPKNAEYVGRMRYLEIGFFDGAQKDPEFGIISQRALAPLKRMRPSFSDKRAYGHLFIFAGNAHYPGAALMNAKSALRSGAGLVSAFVPESIAASMAAAEPACIWIPCPETEDGSLSLETFSVYKSRRGRETAILAGSGLGENPETMALMAEIAKAALCPLVFDADAVRACVLDAASGKNILITPHGGEFLRLAEDASNSALKGFCKNRKLSCLLKGSVTRISDGFKIACNCSGGPILSRAGSGDVLAGLCGGLLARGDLGFGVFESACVGALWAGMAAESAFAQAGETAYATSDIFNFLNKALNE